ncbi:hypothetical protein NQ314_005104 [Rhamnusium bicolor]|uniref:Uncharacterized protein n=1 Tax=Rhamnusium bicolor TaxID=1586634 RepID=A0AAV8ZKS6_9CUCU|nr:hypothetical protein NQ314_005104 [Rhamnusium bicolor]
MGALEDFSQEVREGLHRMLASCRMSTTAGLKMCVEKLLDNLKNTLRIRDLLTDVSKELDHNIQN